MTRDKKRKVGTTAPKTKTLLPKQIKVKQKTKSVNKLDDIWEFEKFIRSIINSTLEVGSSV